MRDYYWRGAMSYVERETGLAFKSQVTYANPGSVGRDIFTCLYLLSQTDDQLPLLIQHLNLLPGLKPQLDRSVIEGDGRCLM